jgi:hypothetical protein
MALDTDRISSGAATATEIIAAYEPLNSKADDYEYCIKEFIAGILEVAGLDGNASFTRSMIINTTENVSAVISAAPYLSEEYVTRKILDIFGDGDQAEAILGVIDAENMGRFDMLPGSSGTE